MNATTIHECPPTSLTEQILSNRQALTVAEVAAYLRVDRKSIYRAVRRGELRALHIGTAVRLDPYRVVEWLNARGGGQ